MGATRRKDTQEYKAEAVELVINADQPVAEIARELGINEGTLGNWVNKAKRDGVFKEACRSQRGRLTRIRMNRIVLRWLPRTRILHPFPDARFAATHPRQEPSAVIPHAGICAGAAHQGGPYRDYGRDSD